MQARKLFDVCDLCFRNEPVRIYPCYPAA